MLNPRISYLMSTHSKVDPSTLGWVKSEIDETLKQARLALESFAENPADKTRLRFCITHLHQVVGTLVMVELDGAALLARETERLAEAILNGKVRPDLEILDRLSRAIVLLPDYLARLQYGQPDMPLRHLPLINELRAARGEPAIAEQELFAPDLSVRPPRAAEHPAGLSEEDYRALARQVRPAYQSALLAWLRDPDSLQSLDAIGSIFAELQAGSRLPAVEQVFWAAGALVEALKEGGLEPVAERKKLFARLDQLIKKHIDGAERAELKRAAEAITRAVLWEVAHARSQGPRVTALKHAFALDSLLAAAEGEAKAYELPSPEVLQSVSQALAKEIENAQDLLTTYFEPGHGDPATLQALTQLLHKMAGTLDMLGVAPLKAVVDELAAVTRAILDGRIANPESASMPMAEGLLLLETSTHDIHRSGAEWKRRIDEGIRSLRVLYAPEAAPPTEGIEVREAELTDAEFKQLLGVVSHEIGVNLSRIEELLEAYVSNPGRLDELRGIPPLLNQIIGALEILGQERATHLAEVTRAHVEALREGRLPAEAGVLDGLAVCIGTIGAYVDGLRTGRRNLEGLVEAALRELKTAVASAGGTEPEPRELVQGLGESLERYLAAPLEPSALSDLQDRLERLARACREERRDKMARIASEMGRLLRLVAEEGAPTQEIATTLRASLAALTGLIEKPPVEDPAPAVMPPQNAAASAKPAVSAEEIDDDIMAIFIEDARDVLGTISRYFANWRADKDDKEALAELRRGYHTLKGSGRMVGASVISELAWSVENMLNRVRDGKIPYSEGIIALLEKVQHALPALIDHLAGGPEPAVDVDQLRAEADALAQGGAAVAATAAVETADESYPEDLPRLDGTLLDIFTSEARSHLANLRKELAACRESGGTCFVTETLFRATHTLAGNARSLSIQMMADACHETERLLQTLRAQSLPLTEMHLDLVDALAGAVEELIELLNRGERSSGTLAVRFAEIKLKANAEAAHAQEHEAPQEPSLSVVAEEQEVDPQAAIGPAFPEGHEAGETVIEEPEISPERVFVQQPVPPSTDQPDRLDPELIEVFREEAVDLIGAIDETLTRWRSAPQNRGAVLDLKRALHTLKGGARMAGAMSIGELAHATESLLRLVEERRIEPSGPLFDALDEVHDVLVAMLDRLQAGQALPEVSEVTAKITALSGVSAPSFEAVGGSLEQAAVPAGEQAARTPEASMAPPEEAAALAAVEDERREELAEGGRGLWPERLERRGLIRVNTDLLNELVNYAGEVSISRARMEQQIYSFRDNLAELARNVTRFREQIRELEIQSESQILYRPASQLADGHADFDPLEFDRYSRLQQLSRQLAESLHDLTTIQGNLGNFVGEAEAVLQQQARLNTDLQEGLMRTRMVSFATQAGRLRHMVRTTARELGKRAELLLEGAEVELDRTVLERMIGPFEHMIRNSIDHGIEPAEVRVRLGKPPVGRITIAVAQEGSEVVIRFSDDGAGLNIEAIRAKAIERALMSSDANLTDEELVQFILMPGFSTAAQVTHVSGRGVGMDVVHNEVKQLGGSMAVDSKRGQGTSFVIRLPLTLSITQALMVHVGDQLYAVPLASVANIIEVPVEKLSGLSVGKNPLLSHNDKVYPFIDLAARLGIEAAARNGKKVPVLIARTGTREIATRVDALSGAREVVIKSLGPQLSEIKGLAGATILGDGRVVLILDLAGLWYRDDLIHLERHAPAAAPETVRARPVIMVVDDSLTVRKVTGKHLQKRGMEVMVAKDGIDAVEQLREKVPDLMLVDIEMPRMDGYELTARVRADERLKHVPIIMITSRAGAKHRQKAMDLGVNLYMTKPYQEDELFKNIDELLKRS